MQTRWIIGLSSGSSACGVDAVLLELEGTGLDLQIQIAHALHLPYSPQLRAMILATPGNAGEHGVLHRVLGETFARAVTLLADKANFPLAEVQCIGCSGHTIRHDTEGRYPSTIALGMPAIIAERTGVTTLTDFRSRDLAVGGQGFPLLAVVDRLFFQDADEDRLLINLGGVSSMTFLPAALQTTPMIGFQSGPCNSLLDGIMMRTSGGREQFDSWGKHAVQGKCIEPLLTQWLSSPALQRKPPRNISRDQFGEAFVAQTLEMAKSKDWSLHDLLCTATHFSMRCIRNAVTNYLAAEPQRIILSGGGVQNGLMLQLLKQHFHDIELNTTEQFGIPVRSRKAVGFGGLAALTVDGVPANLMSVTGASGSRLLGNITPGSTTNWAKCVSWMAGQNAALAAAG